MCSTPFYDVLSIFALKKHEKSCIFHKLGNFEGSKICQFWLFLAIFGGFFGFFSSKMSKSAGESGVKLVPYVPTVLKTQN